MINCIFLWNTLAEFSIHLKPKKKNHPYNITLAYDGIFIYDRHDKNWTSWVASMSSEKRVKKYKEVICPNKEAEFVLSFFL